MDLRGLGPLKRQTIRATYGCVAAGQSPCSLTWPRPRLNVGPVARHRWGGICGVRRYV